MTKTTATALLAVLLLLVPSAAAAWGRDDAVTIEIPHLRVGDRLLYEQRYTEYVSTSSDGSAASVEMREHTLEVVQLVEGVGRAHDKYGLERDVETFRIDGRTDGEPTYSVRCHQLRGGEEAVRVDVLGGASWGASWDTGRDLLRGNGRREVDVSIESHYGGACASNVFGGRTLREGDRIPLPGGFDGYRDNLSQPAGAARVHGRDALVFRFRAQDVIPPAGLVMFGDVELVLVDGLPGVYARRGFAPDGTATRSSSELRGIERGEGPALAAYAGAKLPEVNPAATLLRPDPLRLDDAPWRFRLPYADAFAALRDEPEGRFRRWLIAHPGAFLAMASYEGETDHPYAQGGMLRAEGTWNLAFREGPAFAHAQVALPGALRTPAGDLAPPAAAPPTVVSYVESSFEDEPPARPGLIVDARALAAAARGAGIAPEDVKSYAYTVAGAMDGTTHALVVLSTAGSADDGESRTVFLDAGRGALYAVASGSARTVHEGGLLAAPSGGRLDAPATRASALETLAGPGAGSGLAVGGAAATGLALLVIFLKFVAVPLFTRLRKDRLLDHPVRARLFERIRAEPGIHLAALTDYAGIGKGATRHHVDQLVKHRFVLETPDGGFTRYFAAGEVPPEVARREMALRAGRAREVYELFVAHPSLSLREAAARLGVSAPAVHRVKKRLEREGLLPAAPVVEVRAADA